MNEVYIITNKWDNTIERVYSNYPAAVDFFTAILLDYVPFNCHGFIEEHPDNWRDLIIADPYILEKEDYDCAYSLCGHVVHDD